MRYERLTSRDWAKNKYAVPSYKSLAELEDKIEQGELVSKEWHDEQVLHAEQEIEKLENEIWDMQDKLGCYHSEIKRQRKQAKIEVLETIRQQLTDNGALTVKIAITIDEFMDKIKGETE